MAFLMAPLNIRQLEAFRAVMISGSVTSAGELLRLTQSSVSKLVAQLETDMGILLFDRTRGRLVPRPEAKALFTQVDRAFGVLEETSRNARKLARGAAGHLRLVAIPAVGLELIPTSIGRFLKNRPEVTLEFNIRASTYVDEWVGSRQVDAGFATNAAIGAGITHEELARLNGVCVLPKDHPLAGRTMIGLADIAKEDFVSLGRGTAFRDMTDRAFQDAKVSRRIVIESGYSSVVCSLVAAGVGVAILDPFSALDGWRKGNVALSKFDANVPFIVNSLFPLNAPRSSLLDEFLVELSADVARVQDQIDIASRAVGTREG